MSCTPNAGQLAHSRVRLIGVAVLCLLTSGCASLQRKSTELSLHSYQMGCTFRGERSGLTQAQARSLCECHIAKGIDRSSEEDFIESVNRVGKASRAERDSGHLEVELLLIRGTFHECRDELGLNSEP